MSSSARRRLALTSVAAAAAAAALLVVAPAAHAETIDSMTVDLTVSADTSFRVVETIEYDFEGADRHGIFRDIPAYDTMPSGDRRVYDITVNSVTMDGQPIPVETSEEDPFVHLRIGDPDVLISGVHTYVIDYTVQDGLRVITAQDMEDPLMPSGVSAGDVELYWDLVGTGWEVPMQAARGTVSGPGAVIASACYTGGQGSTQTCPVSIDGASVMLGPVSLDAGSGLTTATVFPASAFSRTPTQNIQAAPMSPAVGALVGLIPFLGLTVIPVVIAISRRREDKGVDLAASPAQYAAPDGLTAAEMHAAYKGSVTSARPRTLVATLVDLAARRWITLSPSGGDLQVTWVGQGSPAMRDWEEGLAAAVLKGQQNAVIEGYDEHLASTWSATTSQLVAEAETSGRRNPKGDAPDRRWNFLALIFVVAFILGFGAAFLGSGVAAAFLFVTAAGALVGFIAARIITPRKETEQSAQFQAKVRGLAKVLGTDAAESRREFAQRTGLSPEAVFATMLPYAIVLDLDDAWVGAFPDLTPEQLTSVGFSYLAIASMPSFVSSGTSSMASAMTAPSSGSGGGGFSGGGGGGGGGGSW